MGLSISVGTPTTTPSADGVVIPVTFKGLKPTDAVKAQNILQDLAGLVQGRRVNMFSLMKLAGDIGLLK